MIEVLIVEDDKASREALLTWCERRGLRGRGADSVAAAKIALAEHTPDLALLDLDLPDGTGLELLEELGASQDTDVVMISGRTTVNAAIDALRMGARDFLTKPVEMPRLNAIIGTLARTAHLRREVSTLRGQLRKLGRFGDLVGESDVMQDVYTAIERVAPTGEPVALVGPTGTGKEVTAQTIHSLSRRHDKPFVPVNCGAVPATLMESEFFGHERGAFTGADSRRRGLFEQADGGTLFLDEITEMPVELQVKLLRVLETGEITRVGGSKSITVDVRIIAATNREPQEAVDDGHLRADLMYRIWVFPIELPPLEARGNDVVLLAQTFLDHLNEENETMKEFSPGAIAAMRGHDWPGNVRELQNSVRRAFVMAKTHIGTDELPELGSVDLSHAAPTSSSDGALVVAPGMSIKEAERMLIEATLEATGGDKKAACDQLGISLKTLYARLRVYKAADGADVD